jgi:hypothetical protein
MHRFSKAVALGLMATGAFGQLTMDQKKSDFMNVAGVYVKNYGPYEWKRDSLGVLLNIGPWLDKISATKNDLDFYEVMVSYVASLNDAHDYYHLPSNFTAQLNFGVDIYDGKLLVDSISRSRLPAGEFPFLAGYELVSIDGQDAESMLNGLLRYEIAANPRSTRRLAAQLLTNHPQSVMPHAADVPEVSTVIFRRPDGSLETYRIPWTKSGLPLTTVGRYITPSPMIKSRLLTAAEFEADAPPEDAPPAYMQPLLALWNCQLPDRAVNGFGSQFPIFVNALPASFKLRLGRAAEEVFYSGTFTAGPYTIGFIRIPNYSPANPATALAAFQKEIAFFEKNTDGLIIDEMRNPGGSISYLNQIVSQLIPATWRSIAFEVRATSSWVASISSSYEAARAQGAPQPILDQLQFIKNAIVSANSAYRGRTVPIPLDDVVIDRGPALDDKGNVIAYDKPIMVLVDEMSASAGDAFAATIQDNARGPLLGWRTMGAGGDVVAWEGGSWSLGLISVTQSLMNRKNPIVTSDYPTAPYVENIGVRPEIPVDYMTRDNLSGNGQSFVKAFVTAMIDHIQKSK